MHIKHRQCSHQHRLQLLPVLLSCALLILFAYSSPRAELPELIGEIRSDSVETWFGYYFFSVGDQNGDSCSDLMIFDFSYTNYLYYGGSPPASQPALLFPQTSRGRNAGDVNGDGFDDFLLAGRFAAKFKFALYYGGPLLDTLRDYWFGLDTAYTPSFVVYAHDLNGDGIDELFGQHQDARKFLQFNLTTPMDTVPDHSFYPVDTIDKIPNFGERLEVADFNGDGYLDLAASWRPNSVDSIPGAVYLYWGGPTFDTLPDLIVRHPAPFIDASQMFGKLLTALGDFNGDGYDDFFTGSHASDDTLSYIYYGGPAIDTIPDLIFSGSFTSANPAGDVNHDGYADLITSNKSYGLVWVYHGGAEPDTIPDIFIRQYDIAEGTREFGQFANGVGDVNGDGIDDYAFSAIGTNNHGVVWIAAGVDTTTVGINDPDPAVDPTLPTAFTLHQNYPNPFNPATTISFSLPYTSTVSLRILNPLGQTVAVLLDHQRLGPGEHQVTWEAEDYASGVYLYELEYPAGTQSRKMVLLK